MDLEGRYWLPASPVPITAVRKFADLLGEALENNDEFFTGVAIRGMREALEAGGRAYSGSLPDYRQMLKRVPTKFEADAQALLELIESKGTL